MSSRPKDFSPVSGIYVIIDTGILEMPAEEAALRAAESGAGLIQLRAKKLAPDEFLKLAARIGGICRRRGAGFIVNDRVDIALAAGADGVHLGKNDMPAAEARRLLGRERIIGLSAGTIEEASLSEAAGADYVGIGPVFTTGTKVDAGEPVGVGIISEAGKILRIPVVAVGGINLSNAEIVLSAGADALAVSSAVLRAPDTGKAVRDFVELAGRYARKGSVECR